MQYRWFDRLTMTFVILSLSKDKDVKSGKRMEHTEGENTGSFVIS
ncbi:MAG: hypothetical protein WC581_04465 [Thermodesulfovibrionales bacterium]